ncbi:MAG: DNA primase [Proteobacteria bacterium]|nr:DNA primase [Pseudomonadota bacterium]
MAVSLDDVKQRIKARVPLEQLVGETVTLVKRGSSITACCPFHAEKTPSFHIYPDNHYYCFGCKENGDAIDFVRKTREMSFIETLKFLASKFGVEAPELEESDSLKRRRGEQAALNHMMVAAQELFTSELRSDRGAPARQYLKDRGFSDENIVSFGFGLTPEEAVGLVKNLRSQGFREDDMVRASLAGISAKSGRPYDFFRERIMIPIRDVQGRVIAFGGRTTSNDPAKYKNSGATPLFDKSSVLFGLDHAKDSIKDKRQAIIVEGYMDTLCLWQEGITDVVASMGTALTVRQLKLLYQTTKTPEVIMLFDGDQAGQKATLAAIDVVLEVPDLRVKAAKLEGGEDPDTFVRKYGKDALREILNKSVDLIDVAIASKLDGANIAAIPTIVNQDFVPWLIKIQDQVKRGYLINRVSGLTGVPAEVLHRQLRSFQFSEHPSHRGWASQPSNAELQRTAQKESESQIRTMPSRPLTPVEKGILGHIYFAEPGSIDTGKVETFLAKELPLEPLWEHFAKQISQSYAQGLSPRHDPNVLASFSAEEVAVLNLITGVAPESFTSTDRNKSVERLICEQKRNNIQQSIGLLKRQVQIASAQSPQDVPKFLEEVMSLNKTLSELNRTISAI